MADKPSADAVGDAVAAASERRVDLAAVAGAHGIRGEVRLKLFGGDLAALRGYSRFAAGGRALTLTELRPGGAGGLAVARFAEVGDRTAAEALRGAVLSVPRSALPPLGEGEYYHVDLIGRPVVDCAGEAVGTVVAVENYGAGDLVEVEKPGGRRFMVPLTPAAVPGIGAVLTVDPAFVD